MKTIIIFLISLFAFSIQANAQTTYSCLEVINGQETGYTLDITIYENSDSSVDYDINRRSATNQDSVYTYILTDATLNETPNGGLSFQTGENVHFIPFDMNGNPIDASYISVILNCLCGPQIDNYACKSMVFGITVRCFHRSCRYWCTSKPVIGGTSYDVSGIFINANSVNQI